MVANSYDFFPLGTDAPIIVFEIFIGRRILQTLILPVVCRVNINIKPQTVGEFGRNDSRDLIFAPGKLFDFGLFFDLKPKRIGGRRENERKSSDYIEQSVRRFKNTLQVEQRK